MDTDLAPRERLREALAGLGASRGDAAALLVLALGALAGLGLLWWAQRPGPPPADPLAPAGPGVGEVADAGAGPTAGPPGTGEVVVHVAGLVVRPGLQHLPAGARVADALEAAGGPLPGAWLDGVNLARRLDDGEQLLVPAAPEAGGQAAAAPPAAGGVAPDGTVSLNRASAAELETLPGIGPVMAERIVEHREQHGPFPSVGALREVRGIGEKTLQALVDRVSR